jgi:hypothetical protein
MQLPRRPRDIDRGKVLHGNGGYFACVNHDSGVVGKGRNICLLVASIARLPQPWAETGHVMVKDCLRQRAACPPCKLQDDIKKLAYISNWASCSALWWHTPKASSFVGSGSEGSGCGRGPGYGQEPYPLPLSSRVFPASLHRSLV